MTDFDWSLAGPFLIVCAAVALLIIPSIAKDVRRARNARRAKATQPEPEPIPYRCAASSCNPVRRDGEWVCGRCGRSMTLNRSAS